MSHAIGIDLGTTNSVVTVVEKNNPIVIANNSGYHTTPSMYAVTEDGKQLLGHLAKRQIIMNMGNTVYAAKRIIGRRFDSQEVKEAISRYAYNIIKGPNNDVRIKLPDREYSIPEISAMVITELKYIASEYLDKEVNKAVITVPAHFSDSQRQATRDAGKIAGLDVLRIINEPTAAAIAYGYGRKGKAKGKVAIYDLGGGTFDISILDLSEDVYEVLATAGDTYLGGEDFDNLIVLHLVEEGIKQIGIDLSRDKLAKQRLKDAAEKAKMDLSTIKEAKITLPFIATNERGPIHFELSLTREKLEQLTEHLIDQTIDISRETLEESGISVNELSDVILVGGQTRMPLVQKKVEKFFRMRPRKGVHPDEVVAIGAALQADMLTKKEKDILLIDVTPLSLGIITYGGYFTRLIPKNTPVPTKKSENFTTVKNNQTSVKIGVFQGESDVAEENELLGEFILDNIPPAPRGEPEIEVTFAINADGMVSVFAKDLATGKEQSIKVTTRNSLTDEELKEMRASNEEYQITLKDR